MDDLRLRRLDPYMLESVLMFIWPFFFLFFFWIRSLAIESVIPVRFSFLFVFIGVIYQKFCWRYSEACLKRWLMSRAFTRPESPHPSTLASGSIHIL